MSGSFNFENILTTTTAYREHVLTLLTSGFASTTLLVGSKISSFVSTMLIENANVSYGNKPIALSSRTLIFFLYLPHSD
jgi:hypothetical protein